MDGLNFYYGISRNYDFKWIDFKGLLQELLERVLEDPQIEKIILFTSTVKGSAAQRQRTYMRALKHYIDCFELHKGITKVRRERGKVPDGTKLFEQKNGELKPVEIITIETRKEKCSDVNFAGRIIVDAYEEAGEDKSFDVACIVTNDSDMAYALELKQKKEQRVVLISTRTSTAQNPVAPELKKSVPKKDRIPFIDKETILRHPLPIEPIHPPNARGWYVPTDQS